MYLEGDEGTLSSVPEHQLQLYIQITGNCGTDKCFTWSDPPSPAALKPANFLVVKLSPHCVFSFSVEWKNFWGGDLSWTLCRHFVVI